MWFINREEELRRLKRGLLQGESFVLIAPRRFGKTTLIKRVLQELEEQTINFYVDLMPYADSPERLMEHMLELFLKGLGIAESIKRIAKGLSLRAKAVFNEIGIEVELSSEKKDPLIALAGVLDIPQKIARKRGKRVLVAYDEFGELYTKDDKLIRLFRSVLQHHEDVSYIFAGSQESLMEKIFTERRGAFFRFGTIIELQAFNIDQVVEFAHKNIPIRPLSISLIQTLKGHPYYTSRFLQKIQAGLEPVDAFEELLMEERGYVELLIDKARSVRYGIEILRAIAMGRNPYYNPDIKKQAVNKVIQKLRLVGFLRKKNRGNYEITDPLLEGYLSGEFVL